MFKINISNLRLGFYDLTSDQLKVVRKVCETVSGECELVPFQNKYYFYDTKEQMFDVLVALSKDYDIELV